MIQLFKVNMNPDAAKAASETLLSGYIGQGPKVEEFERLLKQRFQNSSLVTTNSGTSALHLAMRLTKLYDDKNVALTTPLTCTATNWPLLANNYDLKWVDVDPTTLNMDLVDLERKIDEHTGVIVVVHWGGYPIDLNKLHQIIKRAESKFGHRITVIEDCAHAFGTTYNGKPLGALPQNNYCAFSFQAIKHFTTIDGGMLAMPYGAVYKRAKLLRWYGIDRDGPKTDFRCEADIPEWGYKFHMNDVCASVGIENLKTVDYIIARHKNNGQFFNQELRNAKGVTLLDDTYADDSSYWIYSMHVKNRDDFIKAMTRRGIAVSRVHERNDLHSCVQQYESLLPSLEEIIKTMVCIPCGWWVTDEDREYIVDAIKAGW